jgi:hypothetical protein
VGVVPAEPPPDPDLTREPGDALLHPASVLALGLLLLNDHVLKARWPGPLTGKLSDLAGMVLFPVLLVSAAELLSWLRGRWRGPSERASSHAIWASGAIFLLVKSVPPAAALAGWVLGAAQWAIALPIRVAIGGPVPGVAQGIIVADVTDLVALPMLVVAWWIGSGRQALPTTGRTSRVSLPPTA